MKMIRIRSIGIGTALLSLAICSSVALADNDDKYPSHGPTKVIELPNSTQAFWPPGEVYDQNGDIIVIGDLLTEVQPGVFQLVPHQAALVSKETVPPLDKNGVEDPENWFGAAPKVIRKLDLSPGSPDLDMVLYTASFGPVAGSGGTPRIPKIGESKFNLNKELITCPDTFPTLAQRTNYFRPSYPLHQVPIPGFQGDGVEYDPDTGEPHPVNNATTDPSCAFNGCPGEDHIDFRRTAPITLGEWLKAKGTVKIELTQPNHKGQFTHAKFTVDVNNLIPNAVYTVWAARPRLVPMPGVWKRHHVNPIMIPNVVVTDANGHATREFEVPNPFPDPATDVQRQRIIGIAMHFHSDYQNWGACFSRFGPGVDVHTVFNTLNSPPKTPGGFPDITDFVTVAQ
jgi:hypothetical protein